MPTATAKKRSKTKEAPARFETLVGVNEALGEIGTAERAAAALAVERDQRISGLTAEYETRIRPFAQRADDLRAIIQASAEAHPEWFDKARSAAVPHGRIGWRKVKAIRFLRKVASIIAALRARRLSGAVIVKESVNKDVLATYPDPVLAAVGARRVEKDTFYIELEPAGKEG